MKRGWSEKGARLWSYLQREQGPGTEKGNTGKKQQQQNKEITLHYALLQTHSQAVKFHLKQHSSKQDKRGDAPSGLVGYGVKYRIKKTNKHRLQQKHHEIK